MRALRLGLVIGIMAIAGVASADPSYTLQTICDTYGKVNQCSSVPFCQETILTAGCQLAPGAPAYIGALCQLQTEQQGCSIMAAQGNCEWHALQSSTCNAKFQTL